ncbi:MAG TPA: histidine phosphatase family protein [Acidimicrobiia bacterium]|nr:histidine phosphatase family protein [Acidimicrobiia bacterium]
MSTQPHPPNPSRKEIVFVRHAESEGNRDAVWMGRTDGSLSADGEASLEALSRRLRSWDFDAVISSPLLRATKTAASFTDDFVVDHDFIEMDLGRWEGMPFTEVQEKHGEELREALTTRTLPMGGTGEAIEQVYKRAIAAVDRLFDRMGEDEKVAVVTHGGLLQSVLHRHLAGNGRRVHSFTDNTAITRIIQQFGRPRLASFNDTGHLGPVSETVRTHLDDGENVLALIRHGRTRANVEGRWQGRGDWDLDNLGRQQAAALGEWYGRYRTVYTSPLKRAASTASYVALNGVVPVDGLMEIHMGKWEGMTTDEIVERWSEKLETMYRQGVDLPRGESGETWAQLTERVARTVASLKPDPDGHTVVVAHGGAIRSFISSLTETTDTHAESLFTPANTAVTHVAVTEPGPQILDYSVATHLEAIE